MKALGDLVVAVADFVEAEVRALRRGVARTVAALVMVVVAGWLVFLGFCLGLYAFFLAVQPSLGTAWSALLSAGVTLFLALIAIGFAKWLSR